MEERRDTEDDSEEPRRAEILKLSWDGEGEQTQEIVRDSRDVGAEKGL